MDRATASGAVGRAFESRRAYIHHTSFINEGSSTMLKPKKKITKKELKQDTLVTTYAQVTNFYYANKKYIGYGVFALVVLFAAIFIYMNNRRSNNEKAATALGKIYPTYELAIGDPAQYKVAIEGQPDRAVMGLKAIVDNYGGTDAGEIARLYLANCYFNTGLIDEAMKQFDKFSGSDKLLQGSSIAGLAACYEFKKEYEKAGSYFERASGKSTGKYEVPDYLNSAARCYGLAGEKEKAITLYKRLKKEYPNSPFAREVDRFIAQLSV